MDHPSAYSTGSRSAQGERRGSPERRRRRLFSVWYGSFQPRRRSPARRLGDGRFQAHDWYSAPLFAVAVGIALLSVADAFLTTMLLSGGADEVNPVMAALLYRSAAAFTAGKMLLTSCCVTALVVLSRYRFMRIVRVEWLMYGVLAGYAALIGYEIWLIRGHSDPFFLQFY
jgi:hypothetical protein